MYKKLSIVTLVFILSFWFWVVSKSWVHGVVLFRMPSAWIPALVLLLALSAMLAVSFLVFHNERFELRWALPWAVGFTYLVVFGFSFLNLGAIAGIVFITIYAIKITAIEIRDRTKLHVGLALRRGMPAIIVPLLLAVSFAYYQSPVLQTRLDEQNIPVTARQVVNRVVITLLENEPTTAEIDSEARREVIDNVFDYMTDLFFHYSDKYGHFFPPILAFGLFLILWGISFIFVYFSLWLGMLFFLILKKTEFVRIETHEVTAEQLVI